MTGQGDRCFFPLGPAGELSVSFVLGCSQSLDQDSKTGQKVSFTGEFFCGPGQCTGHLCIASRVCVPASVELQAGSVYRLLGS